MESEPIPNPRRPETRIPLKIEETLAGIAIGILGIITFVNPEFTRLYGYSAEEVVGRPYTMVGDDGLGRSDVRSHDPGQDARGEEAGERAREREEEVAQEAPEEGEEKYGAPADAVREPPEERGEEELHRREARHEVLRENGRREAVEVGHDVHEGEDAPDAQANGSERPFAQTGGRFRCHSVRT